MIWRIKQRMYIYTLAMHMRTSVKMIEQHYEHLKPAQKADVIAGKRMSSKKKPVAAEAQVEEKPKLERVK